MNSAARLPLVVSSIAVLALIAVLAVGSTREPGVQPDDAGAARGARSEVEGAAGDESMAPALEGLPERRASTLDSTLERGADDELADPEVPSGPAASDAAPTVKDVEIIQAEVAARFAGASSETMKEALREAMHGGDNGDAQVALRAHIVGVHAAKLASWDFEVMDAAALERLGLRRLRMAERPELFYGQFELHELPDGRDVRTEVQLDDFAGSGVDFDLAIETVCLERLYFEAMRAEKR